jgi:hypothetical protein
MKIYTGRRSKGGLCIVRVIENGDARELDPRFQDCNKSPTGFEWGYTGSGPTQLAFAILADAMHVQVAHALMQKFKFAVIALLPRNEPWQITEQQVMDFVMAQLKQERTT